MDPATSLRILSSLLCTIQPDWRELLEKKDECHLVTFFNPFSLKQYIEEERFRSDVHEMDLLFADGILLSKVSSWITDKIIPRLAFDGNSIALDVLKSASELSMSIGLVGGKPGEPDLATQKLKAHGIDVAYFHHGYLSGEQRQQVLRDVASTVDVLIVGMGAPLQEAFLVDLKSLGWKGKGFTCGAYISQIAARGPRYYPDIINRLHLRMFYRLIHEPGKLLLRYSTGYLPFYKGSLRLTMNGWK